jgi:hypothetical protein
VVGVEEWNFAVGLERWIEEVAGVRIDSRGIEVAEVEQCTVMVDREVLIVAGVA